MSEVKVNKISPRTGTATTIGDSGDTFTVPSGANLVVAGTLNPSGTITAGSIAGTAMADDAVGVAELSATGTASSSTFLRGDNAWATAGATDVEKVASGAFTTSVIDLQGCFTSTYKFYKLYWGGYSITSGGYPVVGFLDSSHNLITGTGIYESLLDSFSSTSWTTTPVTYGWDNQDDDGFRLINTWKAETTTEGQTNEMFFYDPNSTAIQHVTWKTTSAQDNPYIAVTSGFGIENTGVAHHGLRFGISEGTTTAAGHYALYGYKI